MYSAFKRFTSTVLKINMHTVKVRYQNGPKKGIKETFGVVSTRLRQSHYAKRGGYNLKRVRMEKLSVKRKQMAEKFYFGIEPKKEWHTSSGVPEIKRHPITELTRLMLPSV